MPARLSLLCLALSGCLINHDLYERRLAFFTDADGDGVTPSDGDCDDGDPARFPSAQERCGDGIDNDCDGRLDGKDKNVDLLWYIDADGDGVGTQETTAACELPEGHAESTGDCDDEDRNVFPGATETCNGRDDDCSGQPETDAELAFLTWYADADGDGHGQPGETTRACAQPSGYVSSSNDCDDTAAAIHPDAVERLDGLDEDCNGTVDDVVAEDAGTVLTYSGSGVQMGTALLWIDRDGDGVDDGLVVGGPGDGSDASSCGVLLVEGVFQSLASLDEGTMVTTALAAGCGAGLASLDGGSQLVVASPWMDRPGVRNAGGVAVIDLETLETLSTLTAGPGDRAGSAIAQAGDTDGDGVEEVVIGAPGYSSPTSNAGKIWLLAGSEDGFLDDVADSAIVSTERDAGFGESVAGEVDLNGDGYDDIVVGSSADGEGGRAWLFLGSSTMGGTYESAEAIFDGAPGSLAGAGAFTGHNWLGDGGGLWAVSAPDSGGGQGYIAVFEGALAGSLTLGQAEMVVVGKPADHLGQVMADVEGGDGFIVGLPSTTSGAAIGEVLLFQPGTELIEIDPDHATGSVESARTGTQLGRAITYSSDLGLLALGAPIYNGDDGGAVVLLSW